MIRLPPFASALSFALLLVFVCCRVSADEPIIRSGDRVALVGGTMIESLQQHGDCEVAVLLKQPELKIPFRNLGWSGDDVSGVARRVFGEQPDGYSRLIRDLGFASPTVAVIGYGFAEAADGTERMPFFEQGLNRLLDDLTSANIRPVLLKPFEFPGIRTAGYSSAVEAGRKIVDQISQQRTLPVIDAWEPIEKLGPEAFSVDGLRLSDRGQLAVGTAIAASLLGVVVEDLTLDSAQQQRGEELSKLVAAKNELFFHRHRPMNETYLFLFRKHEQGNNAIEAEKFGELVEQADQKIWAGL